MSFINYRLGEINCKIVYFGSPTCYTFYDLQCIYDFAHTNVSLYSPSEKITVLHVEKEDDEVCFFNCTIPNVGLVNNFKVRTHLYCIKGILHSFLTLKTVLKGVDGIVFIADSRNTKLSLNIEYLSMLKKAIEELGLDFGKIPYAIQFNNRDRHESELFTIEFLQQQLCFKNEPIFGSMRICDIGIMETFNEISQQIYNYLDKTGIPNTSSKC